MTGDCIKSIMPDGLTGIIFALEGMQNTIVLLNGPMGCRFYHSTTSGYLMQRPLLYLPAGENGERVQVDYNYLNDWFFRQERVPCTYLDGYDYVYSTRDKVREALLFIRENIGFDMLSIVNSPGAALIGDNLLEIARDILGSRRVVMAESPGYSVSFEEGYSEACLALLSQAGPSLWAGEQEKTDHANVSEKPAEQEITEHANVSEKPAKTVNLLGISIWHRYFEGDVKEITRLLSLCGIEVNAALCADCSLKELQKMKDADLNIVLDPEMGTEPAKYLEKQTGVPYYSCELLPIGFSATEKMLKDICDLLGTSPEKALNESEKARAFAWNKINGIYQMYGKPKGVTFAVRAGRALEKAYREFLTHYFAMKETDPYEAELVFSNANVISELMLSNKVFCGIEIALPGMGYVDLTVKTHMGIQGALFLIEQVLNGIMSRL